MERWWRGEAAGPGGRGDDRTAAIGGRTVPGPCDSFKTPLLATLLSPTIALAILHSATIGGDRYHAPAVPAAIALVAVAWVAYRRARAGGRAV